jgi:NAD(P)H-hydrate epimerase
LNGDSGNGALCVKSDLTVSIGTYKTGHFLGDAKDSIKARCNVDIGINVPDKGFGVCEASDFGDILYQRKQNSHKGNYGYVGILGGCLEYSGAAKLANLSCAALRSGCGVSTLAVPKGIASGVLPYLLESTLYTMADDGMGHMILDVTALDGFMRGKNAISVGMGWGQSPENQRILTYLLQRYEGTLVIDADGLNALAKLDRNLLQNCRGKVILTPHLKEFERISGNSMEEILRDPVGLARTYARENGVCLLLKGACTVVTDGEICYLVDRGCAGMATAGSGDVLSGVLTGLLGYAEPTPQTVACGAYLAGFAGELAQAENTAVGMIASDTVRFLPRAIAQMM